MKRDNVPELYELLKKSSLKSPKSTQEQEPSATEAPVEPTVKTMELKPLPMTPPVKPAEKRPFPKFKSSFIKEPELVGEQRIVLTYNTAIFLVLLIIIALAGSFVLGVQFGQKPSPKPPVAGRDQPPPTPAPTYGIRLAFYSNTSGGGQEAERLIKRLKDKQISDVYRRDEKIQNQNKIVVYIGHFASEAEAEKTWQSLKSKHSDNIKELNQSKVISLK